MGRLSGKTCLVTGSTRGIGRQIVLGLAAEGAKVLVHGRTLSHTDAVRTLLAARGADVCAVAGDLSVPDEVETLIQTVLEVHGGVDVLYNNAAIQGEWKDLWVTSEADWHAVFQVNVFSLVRLATALGSGMKSKGWGRIVNLTSSIQGVPKLAPYSVSKAAVTKFSQDLAVELQGTGVLVNALDPGWLKTDMAGADAEFEVETVLPGALVPALLPFEGPSGQVFRAQDYKIVR